MEKQEVFSEFEAMNNYRGLHKFFECPENVYFNSLSL